MKKLIILELIVLAIILMLVACDFWASKHGVGGSIGAVDSATLYAQK
jgi:hypothetical protein